jgi:hypothetical protein
MNNNEIKEKYGIEPIMKEMWVWDDDGKEAIKVFVLFNYTDKKFIHQYSVIKENKRQVYYKNASETNPNEKEPKVGDKGYFWDDEESYYYGTCGNIYTEHNFPFATSYKEFRYFSHEKQPWMR